MNVRESGKKWGLWGWEVKMTIESCLEEIKIEFFREATTSDILVILEAFFLHMEHGVNEDDSTLWKQHGMS